MTAYYNEFDPKAAAWLRQLIKMKLITDGEVDDRSITEVTAKDIRGFRRQHFFAGIAGWERALQLAGWPDDRPVCTASLPCQPFSVAGQQRGKSDERHLLPHFIELVKQCNFKTIFGEQVPAAIKHGWLDDLQTNMEAEGYAFGATVLGAHSVGAPHIRQRLYWVGDAKCSRSQRRPQTECANKLSPWSASMVDGLYCRDNKYRPIKPGIKPLVDGISERVVRSSDTGDPIDADNTQEARVMRLKGYGNAVVPQVAASFIKAFMNIE